MITLKDFLRRRTLLTQTHRFGELVAMPGIRVACEILFGDQAGPRYEEYFGRHERALRAKVG